MGVHGLTTLLEKHSRPQVVCRRGAPNLDDAATSKAKDGSSVLLVDASAVQYVLWDRLGSRGADWRSNASSERLYRATCHFYRGIQRAGLRCVLVCDGPCR